MTPKACSGDSMAFPGLAGYSGIAPLRFAAGVCEDAGTTQLRYAVGLLSPQSNCGENTDLYEEGRVQRGLGADGRSKRDHARRIILRLDSYGDPAAVMRAIILASG